MRKVLFLRHKIEGENSIEELANTLLSGISDLELAVFPESSNSLRGMLRNILYARKYQGDINHFISPSECYVCPFINGKKIVTKHDVRTGNVGHNLIKRWFKVKFLRSYPLLFVDKIACITDFTRKELIQMYKPIGNKTCIVYNSYNPAIKYVSHEFNENCPIILHIGTAERKNILRVIQALSGIECRLYIVGKLNERIKQILNECQIDFMHEQDIPFSHIVELYQKCDIVSFPTLYEGFGMPVIEAQAIGRPVVTSRVTSIPEISGNAACFVNPEDVDDIRNGFIKVIHNEKYRNQIIRDGIVNAKRFLPEKMINNYLSLYNKC